MLNPQLVLRCIEFNDIEILVAIAYFERVQIDGGHDAEQVQIADLNGSRVFDIELFQSG